MAEPFGSSPRSSGDRAPPSGGGGAGSNPAGGTKSSSFEPPIPRNGVCSVFDRRRTGRGRRRALHAPRSPLAGVGAFGQPPGPGCGWPGHVPPGVPTSQDGSGASGAHRARALVPLRGIGGCAHPYWRATQAKASQSPSMSACWLFRSRSHSFQFVYLARRPVGGPERNSGCRDSNSRRRQLNPTGR